jgi:trehalose 6-phosphate phosphatase
MSIEILTPGHLPVLIQFALSNVLLAFDYDGTLAPIASTPARARMRRTTKNLLAKVTRLYPCVVISGRQLHDLEARLDRIPVWCVFGNHGLEPGATGHRADDNVRGWVEHLNDQLGEQDGVVIEEKKYSVTIHYRQARDKARARAAISEAARGLTNARTLGGSLAVSVIPRGGPDKGVALQEARRRFACDTAIYVGDDDSDEDAFISGPPEQLLSVRVGAPEGSRARYCLSTQTAIDTLLETLLALRAPRRE